MPVASGLRVVVCDDHRLLREALCTYLRHQQGVGDVVAAEDVDAAVRACRVGADVLVLDLSLGDQQSGTDVLEALHNLGVDVPVLTIGTAADLDAAARALLWRALGHCSKDSAPEVLRDAVLAVAAGEIVLPADLRDELLARVASRRDRTIATLASMEQLTPREHEVLRLLGSGLNRAQIANRLRVSTHTVRTHLTRVMAKLGVNHQLAAIARLQDVDDGIADLDAPIMSLLRDPKE